MTANFLRSSTRRLGVFLALAALYASPVGAQTWAEILSAIRRRFPGVRQISTQELASWLADPHRRAPCLIDVRSPGEYQLSHLRDARQAATVADIEALGVGRDEPIVTYCSVGYRSSGLAEKLETAGFTRVVNLEGSIFAWANEGQPVFRGTNLVQEVHPYSAKWGQLLNPKFHPPR